MARRIRAGQHREWRLTKAKDGEGGKVHPFLLEVVDLGVDDEGWPINSCVVAPEKGITESVSLATNLPQGGNQRVIWDGLEKMFKESAHFGMAGAAPTCPCVEFQEAIAKLRDSLHVASNRQTERAREAINGLIHRGLLIHRDRWLWRA